jgi:sigma-B regulation protein RsbQ
LKDILTPALILQSDKDSLASPEVGKYMTENIPDSQLELIQAEGHCLHMTDPDLIIPLLINFIQNKQA